MKSWKTTIIGCGGAVLQVIIPLIQTGGISINQILSATVMAMLGYFAKDKNVTGK